MTKHVAVSGWMDRVDSWMRALWLWKWRALGVSLGARLKLYEQFAFFVGQNIPVPRMLSDMMTVLTPRKRPIRWLLERWASRQTLSIWDAMAEHVPAVDSVSIRAGSMKGDLSRGFRQAHKLLLAQKEMVSAMVLLMVATLPTLSVGIVIIFQMSTKMTPMMTKMIKPETPVPETVTNFVSFSNHVVQYGVYYGITALVLGVFAFWSLPRWSGTRQSSIDTGGWKGVIRHGLDRFIPPYSLYRAYLSATLTTAVAGMVEADFPFVDAVREVGKTGSPWMRAHMQEIERGLKTGRTDYGESLVRSGLFTPGVEDEILIVSRSGALNAVLPVIADRILNQTIARFKAAATVAGFAVLILVGAFAGWMILAMFGLTDAYQAQFDSRTTY